MAIPFTQYLLPDGRRRSIEIDASPEAERLARELLDRGVYFDAEILTTGAVSLTAERDEKCLAHEVVGNGPGMLGAVERLIGEASAALREAP